MACYSVDEMVDKSVVMKVECLDDQLVAMMGLMAVKLVV